MVRLRLASTSSVVPAGPSDIAIGVNLAARLLFSADSLDDYRSSDWVDIVVSLLDIAATVLAVMVVRRITAPLGRSRIAAVYVARPLPVGSRLSPHGRPVAVSGGHRSAA